MDWLRVLGFLATLLVAVLAGGAIAGVAGALFVQGIPVAAASAVIAVVLGVAALVVATGAGGARTRASTYW